ncbi:dTDP-4-dehydrorhamnose reductase [Halalkalibaculum sp. DA3122]|uniref:dTDP-4-dehydrorhamnose reductase n=1 Tax=unclassified Halalkalibaculum TaxID=2964617 RepID=UPI003754410F
MKGIIFGAGGQLGREWMDQLNRGNVPLFDYYSGFGSDQLDITDDRAVAEILDAEMPDVVVNCAAYTDVDRAEDHRKVAVRVNGTAVKSLAGQCAEREIKLVHYSTDYVFPGRSEDRRRFPEGYPEDHETSPVNWYGATKLKGEQGVRQAGCEHLIIRVSWLCGFYGSNFIKTMLQLADQRSQLDVVDDQWGSPTFTGPVVQNTLSLLRNQEQGVYHITSGGLTSWYELACEIFRTSGHDIQVNPVSSDAFETRAKRPRFSKLSTRKAAQVPGVIMPSWREGLKNLLKKLNVE